MEQVSSREEVKFIYDYVVNIFKAHGLSIVAALSADIPAVSFSPMDADNTKDIIAAKKAEVIGKLIQKYNKSKLLFYHALFTLYTNHFVAAYNYYERDKRFGIVEIPKFGKGKITPDTYNCPNCDFSSEIEQESCPNCLNSPLQLQEGEEGPVQVGTENIDKGMEKLIIKGTLNIKIPTYAADQDACGYLIDYSDQHFAHLRYMFPNIDRNKISLQGSDNFERIARMPSIGRVYSDTYLQSLLTLERIWLRPWMFDMLDEKEANELRENFPSGVRFSVIESGEGIFAEAEEEDLDTHWTITKGDLSRAIHGDPLGKPLLPMQDLENMVTNLLVESLEHSVPTTWADPEIVDFETYSKQEVTPGAVYPAKNSLNPNRRLDDYFYTLKTAALPKEGVDFDQIIQSKGQFLVGAFPSIFGGPQTEGSKTLGEYQESRGYALQRLSIPYQFLFFWWSDVTYKSVKDYIRNMIADEKHSDKTSDGKFVSINLLIDEFSSGKFNLLVPESAIDLPVSFSQKRTTLQNIIQLNSDTVNQFLFSPENRRITLKYIGIEEFNDLDSNQTMKQLMEIEELIRESPIMDDASPELEERASVPTEPELDDDAIHLRVIKTFASSDLGQEEKRNNPEGYKNLLLHAREHYQRILMSMQPPEQSQIKVNNNSSIQGKVQ